MDLDFLKQKVILARTEEINSSERIKVDSRLYTQNNEVLTILKQLKTVIIAIVTAKIRKMPNGVRIYLH